ncbi:MAG TPA: hypothetical protein VK599_01880 [Streptosporangiaceae bacterium]|nr:hypothetical protein [Streptosporangiaceae bacterium]
MSVQRGGHPAELPLVLRWPGLGGLAGMAAFLAVTAGAATWAHWGIWPALAAGIAAQAAVMTVVQVRPREVPPGLAGPLAKLEEGGFRRMRLHPFTCTEANPHAHVRGPYGKGNVTVALVGETTEGDGSAPS